jgi:hypothetical protein
MSNATEDLDLVLFDGHPLASPVAHPSASQFSGDAVGRYDEAAWQPFHDGHQSRPV